MVTQERLPSLARPGRMLGHVFGDSRLGDLITQLQHFAMDTGCTPQRILQTHTTDQAAHFSRDLRATSERARLPAPIQMEAHPMPPDEGVWPDDDCCVQERWHPTIQPDKQP